MLYKERMARSTSMRNSVPRLPARSSYHARECSSSAYTSGCNSTLCIGVSVESIPDLLPRDALDGPGVYFVESLIYLDLGDQVCPGMRHDQRLEALPPAAKMGG